MKRYLQFLSALLILNIFCWQESYGQCGECTEEDAPDIDYQCSGCIPYTGGTTGNNTRLIATSGNINLSNLGNNTVLMLCGPGPFTLTGNGKVDVYICEGTTVTMDINFLSDGRIYNRGTINTTGNFGMHNSTVVVNGRKGVININGSFGDIRGKFSNFGKTNVAGDLITSPSAQVCLGSTKAVLTINGKIEKLNSSFRGCTGSCIRYSEVVELDVNDFVHQGSDFFVCQVSTTADYEGEVKWNVESDNYSKGCLSCCQIPNPVTTPVSLCQNSTLPLSITDYVNYNHDYTLTWYTEASGGIEIPTPRLDTFTVAKTYTYYVTQTDEDCESERVPVTVTVTPFLTRTIDAEICEGGTYHFYGTPFMTAVTAHEHRFVNTIGCDSIVTLNLTVKPILRRTIVGAEICEGDTYYFYGTPFTTAVTAYEHRFANATGCDSIVTLNLIVKPILRRTIVDAEICEGDTYYFYGTPFTTAVTAYEHRFANATGCDSIVTLNLTVKPILRRTIVDAEICEGDTYYFYGIPFTTAVTAYEHRFANATGCDSIVTLNLTVKPVLRRTIADAEICEGDTYYFYGMPFTTAVTAYEHRFANATGCDSIVTLNLTVNPVLRRTIANAKICEGDTYYFYGMSFTTAVTAYEHRFANTTGCDSIVTLNLTVNPILKRTINATICDGETYIFYGTPFTTSISGLEHRFSNTSKCDSIVTLNLTVNLMTVPEITGKNTVCAGNSVSLSATATTTTTNVITYKWQGSDGRTGRGSTFNTGILTKEGSTHTYTVTAYSGDCETESEEFTVSVVYSPKIIDIRPTGARSREIVIDERFGTSPFYYGLNNSPADEYPDKYNLRLNFQHTFYVVDAEGCRSEMKHKLIPPDLIFPPYFSPNGDGTNDTWEIENLREYYPNAVVKIFDRFGRKLIEYPGYKVGWDGTYLGNKMPSTDYWYVVFSDEFEREVAGHFTLLRR